MKAVKKVDIARVWNEYLKNKDDKSRNKLLLHYLPIVKYTAIRLHSRLPRSVDLEDLISVGIEGLMKAIDSYDPHRKILFETYCPLRIRGEILDDLRKNDWIPRLVRQRAQQLQKATQKLESLYGRQPTEIELAKELNMVQEEFAHFQKDAHALNLISLNSALSDGDRDKEFQEIEIVADRKSKDPYWQAQKKDSREYVLKGFHKQEKLIMVLYYFEEMTMREIGETLGISESRVCQIHTSIIERLKSHINRKSLMECLRGTGA